MTLVKINNCKGFIVSLTIDIDLSLIHETQNCVNQKINKIIKQNVFIRVLYEKNFYLVEQYATMKTKVVHLYCYQKNHVLT